jgi:hypothetical protein
VFVLGFCSPALIPLVTRSNLPVAWKTTISGALAVGVPEVMSLLAVAIMGKAGFRYLKDRIFSFLKKQAPPDQVGPIRYRIGLAMFIAPLLYGWLAPYVPELKAGLEMQTVPSNIVGDLVFVGSFFVLGGDFWDKLRALFVREARAVFPESS